MKNTHKAVAETIRQYKELAKKEFKKYNPSMDQITTPDVILTLVAVAIADKLSNINKDLDVDLFLTLCGVLIPKTPAEITADKKRKKK